MCRVWIIAVLLLCAWAPRSWAQGTMPGAMLGLPLVTQEGGWARYVAESSEGSAQFVFKVGSAGKYKGRSGRWLTLEIEVPDVGRITFQFLVEGERFTPKSVVVLRVATPGQAPQETPDPFADTGSAPVRKPKLLRQGPQAVLGKQLPVSEYSFDGGLIADWSPSVPGIGLTRFSGPSPFQLVAFGVGGDPWKGAARGTTWPEVLPNKK